MKKIRQWDYSIMLRYYDLDEGISLEDLYQEFKARLKREKQEEAARQSEEHELALQEAMGPHGQG